MARIICDNTEEITHIQPQAFKVAKSSKLNHEYVSCEDTNSIPKVDFSVFG